MYCFRSSSVAILDALKPIIEMASTIGDLAKINNKISASAKEQFIFMNNIKEVVEQIVYLARENNQSINDVSANIEENSASIEELVVSFQSLTEMAKKNSDIVKRFKT